jgi:hypothetical protein
MVVVWFFGKMDRLGDFMFSASFPGPFAISLDPKRLMKDWKIWDLGESLLVSRKIYGENLGNFVRMFLSQGTW